MTSKKFNYKHGSTLRLSPLIVVVPRKLRIVSSGQMSGQVAALMGQSVETNRDTGFNY